MTVFPALGSRIPPRDPSGLAREILSQPRFRVRIHATPHTWLDWLRQWLSDRWSQLLDVFSHHVHLGARATIAAGDLLIAAVTLVVVIAGVRLLLGMARESASNARAASALPVHGDPRTLYVRAQAAAQREAYSAAIALLFQACLAQLDARGILRDHPSRTVNECRADVREHVTKLSEPFDVISRAFTAAVYAEEGATADAWGDADRAYAAFAAPHRNAA